MKKNKSIKNKFILTVVSMFTGSCSFAQTPATASSENFLWLSSSGFYLGVSVMLILMILILVLSKTSISLGKAVAKTGKKSIVLVVLLLANFSTYAQQSAPVTTTVSELPAWVDNPNVYLLGLVFLIMLISIWALYSANMKLIKALSPKAAKTTTGVKEAIETMTERKSTFLRKVYLRLVDSVPVAKEKDIMLDHDYDGIKELDNNLPPWWKYGFYVTIIFGIFYLLIYHVSGTGKLQAEEYKDELLLAQKQKEERMKASAENVNEENVIALTDAEPIANGKETFLKLCSACHRTDGGGQVGPNLTDEYWIHGGGVKNIFKTITYGVPSKGMLSWQSQLSPKQIQQVASYILTLKGSNPAGGKEAQGDKWVDGPATVSDSTGTSKVKMDTAMVAVTDTMKQ